MHKRWSIINKLLAMTMVLSLYLMNITYAFNVATPSDYTEAIIEKAAEPISGEMAIDTETTPEDEALINGFEDMPLEETIEPVLSPAFFQEQVLGNVRVSVSAPEGVFPEDAILSVKRVRSKSTISDIEEAVEEERREEINVAGSYYYDIKVLLDGEEVEPNTEYGMVQVSFSLNSSNVDSEAVNVYHIIEEENGLIAEEMETDTFSSSGDTSVISIETDCFSYYVVEFTYEGLEYVLEGDTDVRMAEILDSLGLMGTVSHASVSDEKLLTVVKDGYDWIVKARQPFTTTEWMDVTIDGLVFRIILTDTIEETQITKQPVNQKVPVGGQVNFSVEATGVNLRYQWQQKRESAGSWSNISGKTASTLSWKTGAISHGMQYRCVVTGDGGSVASNAAQLTIATHITKQPVNQKVAVGSQVNFSVEATGVNLRYQWQQKRESASSWSNISGRTESTLSWKVGAISHGMQYRCVVTGDGGSVTSNMAQLTIDSATVSFDNNGGKGKAISSITCIPNTSYQLPMPDAAKKNCYFKEWNTKSDGEGTAYKEFTDVNGLGSEGPAVKLYAIWQAASSKETSMSESVFSLVNQKRTAAGVPELTYDADLSAIAMERAKECAHLFSHTRPNGEMYTDLVNKYGYVYTAIGENIAAGQTSAAQVMNDWMNSAGHRANILNSSYTAVGIGCCLYNGVYYWVQNFGRSEGASVEPEAGTPSTMAFAAGTKVQVSSSTPHFAVIGSVSTNYSMKKIIYEITTPALYRKMTYTWSGGGTSSVTLGDQINATLNAAAFNGMTDSQARGSYILKVTAEDTSGKTIVKTINWTY